MATHQIPILGANTIPDDSGEVFFQPYSIVDTAAVLDALVLTFNDSGTKDGVRGVFTVPQNYAGSASIKIVWCADDGTTNSVTFDLSYLTRSGAEDMGAAATATSDTVTDNQTSTPFLRQEAEISVTSGNFVAGDQVIFELFRDSPNDTMAAAVLVFQVLFEYDDA